MNVRYYTILLLSVTHLDICMYIVYYMRKDILKQNATIKNNSRFM